MEDHTGPKILTRDCQAIRIPSGETFMLQKDTMVTVTQALGGELHDRDRAGARTHHG